MIVCVSVNPALDRCIWLPALRLGQVNRATRAQATPGGKAANVALAARALGASVHYVALLGGATGRAVADGLAEHGVKVEAVPTRAATRVNLELLDEHCVTEVLEPGEEPTPDELQSLRERCRAVFAACSPGTVVAFSGSLPAQVEPALYTELVALAKTSKLRVILDTSGRWLECGLAGRPDFVKPNREEAEAVLKRSVASGTEAHQAIRDLVARGTATAIVSLGAEGLVAGDGERTWRVVPPAIVSRSAVASGDATIAGLAVALERGDAEPDLFAFAAACGAANCKADSPAQLDPTLVGDLHRRTIVSSLP